jgi:hypothetical protein
MTNEDFWIGEYAARIQRVYDLQCAGDHTFSGILSDFLKRIDQTREEHPNREEKE